LATGWPPQPRSTTQRTPQTHSCPVYPDPVRAPPDQHEADRVPLQANTKTVERKQHPDRDAQFAYLNSQAMGFTAAGDPVVSVDTKKKQLVGNFAADGREYEPVGQPRKVLVHDFADKDLGKVAPYGVYDIAANTGWVNVGTDADTDEFAVESIRRWWNTMGSNAYPGSSR
jgi:hypothetical protein